MEKIKDAAVLLILVLLVLTVRVGPTSGPSDLIDTVQAAPVEQASMLPFPSPEATPSLAKAEGVRQRIVAPAGVRPVVTTPEGDGGPVVMKFEELGMVILVDPQAELAEAEVEVRTPQAGSPCETLRARNAC